MELSEALEFLSKTKNTTSVAITIGRTGRAQSTVVGAGYMDGKVVWISRGHTVKIRNVKSKGRATVTVINRETHRYVTVEGPAIVHEWSDAHTTGQVQRLKKAYTAMGRPPKQSDADFAAKMAEEKRAVIEVTPESWYGSLTVR